MKKVLFLLSMMLMICSAKAYDFSAVTSSGHTLYYNIVSGGVNVTYPGTYWAGSYWDGYTKPIGNLIIDSSVSHGGITYSVLSIGTNSFMGCPGLTSVIINNGVTTIGSRAFYGCTGISSISIPNSVDTIDGYAFYLCSSITDVTIPNSTTCIGGYAFSGCTGLTSITIPESVISIWPWAFNNCPNLITVNYNAQNCTVYDGFGSGIGGGTNWHNVIFGDDANISTITIGENVQSLPHYMFNVLNGLTTIYFYSSNFISDYCEYVFWGSNNVSTITIGENVSFIPGGLFDNCSGCTSVYFNASNCTLSSNYSSTFAGNSSITNVIFGNRVHYIPNHLFENCTGITSIILPDSVFSIGNGAFLGCSGLASVLMGNSVATIGTGAFYECRGLTSIILPSSLTSIGSEAFRYCSGLTSITIPDSVISIGTNTFRGCTNLGYVILPNSLTTIGEGSFEQCTSLTTINIPPLMTTLAHSLFKNCSSLTTLPINSFCTSIGDNAFNGCSGLTTITIPESVTTIGSQSFANCSNLTTVFLERTTPPSLGSNAFGGNTLIGIPCGSYYYYLSSWGNRNYFEPVVNICIVVWVNDSIRGSASCVHTPPMYLNVRCDSTAIIQATPNYGYHFDHWSTGSTQSLDTVHLTGDCTITAYFAKNQYTVTALTNQGDRGSVTGSATVDYLDNVTLTASANYGYHFSHWSDGSTENPHQVTANENKTIYAYFDPNQYLLIVLSADATMGDVSGDGSFDYLSNRTISATANYGYHFEQWNDGIATSSRIVTLTQDTTFTASFGKNRYTLNVQSNDASLGTVTGSGTYEYLDMVEITATAIEHHHFVRWSDGNTNNPRVYQVTGDANITAIFAIDTHYVNVTCDIARGTVSGSGYYAYGSACTVMAENIYTGFVFHSWSNGVTANPYVFAVLDDIELYAIFVAEGEEVYTVTVESADPSMGTASGGGQALSGGEVVIWATSNPGHRFVRWNDNNTDSVRTVIVTADVTYTAYFEATTQGINEVLEDDIRILVQHGQIIVEGVEDKAVRVFDLYGRLVETRLLPTGVYIVKIGDHPARKVVVIR